MYFQINNAGIISVSLTTETDEKTIDKLFEVNTKSHVALTKLAVPYLKTTKGNWFTLKLDLLQIFNKFSKSFLKQNAPTISIRIWIKIQFIHKMI